MANVTGLELGARIGEVLEYVQTLLPEPDEALNADTAGWVLNWLTTKLFRRAECPLDLLIQGNVDEVKDILARFIYGVYQ